MSSPNFWCLVKTYILLMSTCHFRSLAMNNFIKRHQLYTKEVTGTVTITSNTSFDIKTFIACKSLFGPKQKRKTIIILASLLGAAAGLRRVATAWLLGDDGCFTAGLLGDDVGFTAGLLGGVGFVAFLQKIIRDMFAKYKEGSNNKLGKMLEYGWLRS